MKELSKELARENHTIKNLRLQHNLYTQATMVLFFPLWPISAACLPVKLPMLATKWSCFD